eukprot:CAMPEP_0175751032 /NCGR_PEP_ID=MMETSP0097-20121207/60999_1 /TAXON_ID=311494 /ORGANISM="Alexandrium monilatum, Strain CCMP3105" /LENGTH=87 /DNA_ID=CAMNT_0017059691 /DNA_START=4 /DNA_END=264 /DNA_ORIENTATION=+
MADLMRQSSDPEPRRQVQPFISFAHLLGQSPPKLPEQGYHGKDVGHANMKTVTADWREEYGEKEPPVQKPPHSGCGRSGPAAPAVLL